MEGGLAEQFVGQELRSAGPAFEERALYYWHREAKNANAEVDYLCAYQDRVVPVEVRAGTSGSLKSLQVFLAEKGRELAVRSSPTWADRRWGRSRRPLAAGTARGRSHTRSSRCPCTWPPNSTGSCASTSSSRGLGLLSRGYNRAFVDQSPRSRFTPEDEGLPDCLTERVSALFRLSALDQLPKHKRTISEDFHPLNVVLGVPL